MASDCLNNRRKSCPTSATYEQLAGRPAKPDAAPLVARAARLAKPPSRNVDGLRASPAAGRGVSRTALAGVALVLVLAIALVCLFWPHSEAISERSSAPGGRRAEASKAAGPMAANQAPPRPEGSIGASQSSVPQATAPQDNVPQATAPQATTAERPELGWEELLTRGDQRARARQWRAAASDFTALVSAHGDDHWHWFRGATLLAWTKDAAAYRKHCTEMLQRFAEPTDPIIAERTAKSCLLLPGGVADLKPVIRLADQAFAATDHQYYSYFLMARGLAHYRAGEFDKALERTSKSISGNAMIFGLDVPAHLIVAMSHHKLGQAAEARKSLDKAREIMGQEWFPQLDSGELGQEWWHDWLICQVLRREAESLIEGKKAP